jgi:hypothetical protein
MVVLPATFIGLVAGNSPEPVGDLFSRRPLRRMRLGWSLGLPVEEPYGSN